MKRTLILASLVFATSSASAGFFDSVMSKKNEIVDAVVSTEAVKSMSQPVESSRSVTDSALGLLPTLSQNLGVSNSQAEGGMGALLQLAQKNLTGAEFSSLSQGIPGIEGMLAAAPSIDSGESSGLGGMLSKFGGSGSALGAVGLLTQQFEALGLSSDMVLMFAKGAMDYFSDNKEEAETATGGIDLSALLQKGLGAVLN
jgi:hypothetical protein